MSNEERAALLGDELTRAIEAYAKGPTAQTLSDFSAALIGRCTSMIASALIHLHQRMDKIEGVGDG